MSSLGLRLPAALLLVGLTLAPRAGAAGQDKPPVDEIMARAGRYVTEFVNRFANVVAEERYKQQASTFTMPSNMAITGRGGSSGGLSPRNSTTTRELKSDFLLVTIPSSGDVMPFRDTFEVDGMAVRDRQQRLAKLFLQPLATAFDQAAAISDESARYNIGNLTRTINSPIFALLWLQSSSQSRFTFTVDKPDPATGADVWIVEYREEARPTIVRGPADRDLPAHGRFWIGQTTGRVLKSELLLAEPGVSASLTTTFRTDAAFGIDVPSEMREEYRLQGSQVSGQATYGRFRRFGVNTDEVIQK